MPNEENTEAGRVTLESVLASENLHAAWLKVKANDGAAGVDRRDIATTKTHLRENWKTIAAKLRTGDYQPGAVRAARPPASLPIPFRLLGGNPQAQRRHAHARNPERAGPPHPTSHPPKAERGL